MSNRAKGNAKGKTKKAEGRWLTADGLTQKHYPQESNWSRKEGHTVDALALRAEEGRGKLRKATGSCKQA